ncbi:hypothetical protein PLEOSDRAFT_1101510 [Pleurotus ostreatus PC15]|uniref:Cytochrome P450 n=1 Tax=Pleurotus ostreatus (strain PC15) TaxID=1137138 RepID=A0A067NU32_PLEO1|nr:hypothetical protein PLEOSDRAFT_1101510 [Pleurotus ostreatus PC15]
MPSPNPSPSSSSSALISAFALTTAAALVVLTLRTAMGRVLLDAGTKTSASFLHSFVMAMACHPAVQARAQAEPDDVLGDAQMPVLEDYGSLPYLDALIKLHRFRPIVPTGVPHVASRATQYNGFVIPKGSIIFMNTWGVYHDPEPELFDDPESFKPERYLLSEFGTKPGADTEGLRDSLPFGAGRVSVYPPLPPTHPF